METLLTELAASGPIAIVLAWVLFQNKNITNRLFEVIENNTKALTELTEEQKRRREEFKKGD